MKKRFLSVALVLCMILCLAPVSAFAAEGHTYGALVEYVQQHGKYDADDNEYMLACDGSSGSSAEMYYYMVYDVGAGSVNLMSIAENKSAGISVDITFSAFSSTYSVRTALTSDGSVIAVGYASVYAPTFNSDSTISFSSYSGNSSYKAIAQKAAASGLKSLLLATEYMLEVWSANVNVGDMGFPIIYNAMDRSSLSSAFTMTVYSSGTQTHTHSYTAAVTAPTCTAQGYTTYTCSCGDSYTGDYTAALGHNYSSTSVVAPTCTEDGYTLHTCSRCGDSYKTDTVAALGHKFGDDSICTVCGMPDTPFTDIRARSFYVKPLLWAINHDPQITKGTSDTTFSPDEACTRAQVVTFLWRAAGCPTPESTSCRFTDVRTDGFYYTALLWATEQGVVNGTSETTFSPDETVTRGQFVTFLYRLAGRPDASGTTAFTDLRDGAFYTNAVLWAAETGVTAGTSETTFSPDEACTRAQVVTFLYRYFA